MLLLQQIHASIVRYTSTMNEKWISQKRRWHARREREKRRW